MAVWDGLRKLGLACAVLPVLLLQADAAVIDRPFFRANALVIVFSGGDFVENDGEAPSRTTSFFSITSPPAQQVMI